MSGENGDMEGFLAAHGPFDKPSRHATGSFVGDWRILAFLGRGASSEVYRAENRITGQIGAVKVLVRSDKKARGRFCREVALLADAEAVVFPHFYGAGEHDGCPYLATEFLEPVELPSSDGEIARFVLGVCGGVEALHRRGYIHRDIKPANIMRRPATGEPVLIDFGLAKESDECPRSATDTISVVDGRAVGVGTPGYSAPEQFIGGSIDATADIHALGMLANACFRGKPPRAWTEIIRRATSSLSAQRYATIAEFALAVRTRHLARHIIVFVAAVSIVVLAVIVGFSRRGAEARRMAGLTDSPNRVAPANQVIVVAETADDLLSLGEVKRQNDDLVTTIELDGRDITLSNKSDLARNSKIVIVGPGRVTGSISGDCGASVELKKGAMLINLTTTPYPESAMKYILTGDAYLNFKNLDRPKGGDIKNVWADDSGGGLPSVDFRGPDMIDFEQAKAINNAAWTEAVKQSVLGNR